MSTAVHTIGAIDLPRGMVWVDEFDWVAAERAVEYSTTGALLVDVGTRQAGRPITLQADDDAGWRGMTRATLAALRALAANTATPTHTLTLADARVFTVMFAPDNPLQARPIGRPELPAAAHPYVATVRLLEVPAP